MNTRRFLIEAGTLIVSAAFCGLLANQFASRERKLNLPGNAPAAVGERRTAVGERRTADSGQPTSFSRQQTAVSSQPAEVTETVPPERRPPTADRRPPDMPTPKRSPQFLPHPDRPWVEIDPEAVRELYQRGVVFIDARRTSVYEEGHIAGARSIPVWEADLDERLNAIYEEGHVSEAPMVVYCSGGDCEDSHMLSQRLWGIGFNNVLVYKDGYPDWIKNHGPVETGPAKR